MRWEEIGFESDEFDGGVRPQEVGGGDGVSRRGEVVMEGRGGFGCRLALLSGMVA